MLILACLSFVACPVVAAVVVLLVFVPVILVAAVAFAVAAAVASCVVAAVYRRVMRGRCNKHVFSCIAGRFQLLPLFVSSVTWSFF